MRTLSPLPVLALFAFLAPAALAAGDQVIIGLQQEPTTLDPTADATASIDTLMTINVFEPLVMIDDAGLAQPLLAKSWTVSPDNKTYTFKLIEDAKFSDGKPLTAATVKFSFDRAMAPDSVNPTKVLFSPIAAVETPDATTIILQLKKADNFLLFGLGQGDAAIVHPDTAATNKTQPIGSGPYKLKSWTKGDRLVLEQRADLRGSKPAIREATFRFVADPAAAVAALLSSDIDAFPNVPAPESVQQFEKDRRFKVVSGSTEGEVIMTMNNARRPFDDVRVRRAVSHLIDRKAIIDGAMYGHATPIGSHFPPHHPAYTDQTGRYPLDPAKAKALLAEAGFPNGIEATLRLPPFPYARRSGEILQSQLAAGGVKVKIENVEWGFWIGNVYKGDYDLTIIAHVAPNDLGNYARDKTFYNGYDNKAFQDLYARLTETPDRSEMTELMKKAQAMIADDAVNGFLFQLPQLGVYKAGLAGYRANSSVPYAPLANLKWQ